MATFANHSTNESSGHSWRCQFKEDFKYILLPVSYTLVFVIGLALNVTAMYVILFRTKRWKPSTVYMFNLTVCDTLYILTLPFLIYYYADENDWPFSEPFCKLIRFLFYANLYGSILFLCCISLHRFLGVCYPMRSLSWVSSRRARLVSAAVWACVLMCQAPVLYFSRTRDEGTERVCFDTSSPELFNDFLVYSSVVSVLMFAFPFMVVMVCYGLMVRKLLEPTWGAGGSQSRGVGGLAAHRSKHKSVKMIIIVLAVFMLCFLPFHLTRSLYYSLRYLEQMDPSQVQYLNHWNPTLLKALPGFTCHPRCWSLAPGRSSFHPRCWSLAPGSSPCHPRCRSLAPGSSPCHPRCRSLAPGSSPCHPRCRSLAPGSSPCHPGCRSLAPGSSTCHPGCRSLAPGSSPCHPGCRSLAPGSSPCHPRCRSLAPGSSPCHPRCRSLAPGSSPFYPRCRSLAPGRSPCHPRCRSLAPGCSPFYPRCRSLAPGRSPCHPRCRSLAPGSSPCHPRCRSLAPGRFTFHPRCRSLAPGSSPFYPRCRSLAPGSSPCHPRCRSLAPGSSPCHPRFWRSRYLRLNLTTAIMIVVVDIVIILV
ncbi:P2Y purinoceptor 4-like isoform X18 [Oncorhynchus keta]|uniref:P2Y purinoceptor 4-like isoform X18 n=1 Tax=Oncorhynchus keta TaxID=8018 RepID=UPI00227AB3AB|nr:P2Y purinoceptor 4-like isoform X18 [Oncorhynchus keta]